MGILDWLLHPRRALSRRRAERQRAVLVDELRSYERLLGAIAFNPSVTPDTSLPMEGRADAAIAKVVAQFATFRAACAQAAATRDALARGLDDPRLDVAVRAQAGAQYERLARTHPSDTVIAALEAQWRERLERLDRIARPAPTPRGGRRRPPVPGVVPFDLQDRRHRGWWHGA